MRMLGKINLFKIIFFFIFIVSSNFAFAGIEEDFLIFRSNVSVEALSSKNKDTDDKAKNYNLKSAMPVFKHFDIGDWSYVSHFRFAVEEQELEDDSSIKTGSVGGQVLATKNGNHILAGAGALFLDATEIQDTSYGYAFAIYGHKIFENTLGLAGLGHVGYVEEWPVFPVLGFSYPITSRLRSVVILPAFFSLQYTGNYEHRYFARIGGDGIYGYDYVGDVRGNRTKLAQIKTSIGTSFRFAEDFEFTAELGGLGNRRIIVNGSETELERAGFVAIKIGYFRGGTSVRDLIFNGEE